MLVTESQGPRDGTLAMSARDTAHFEASVGQRKKVSERLVTKKKQTLDLTVETQTKVACSPEVMVV